MMKEEVAIAGPVVQKLASRKALCIIEISFVGCITEPRAALRSICGDRCRIYGASCRFNGTISNFTSLHHGLPVMSLCPNI